MGFFHLLDTVQNMGVVLLNLMVDYVRHIALQRICKAFQPTISLSKVIETLHLDVENPQDSKILLDKQYQLDGKEYNVTTSNDINRNLESLKLLTKKSFPAVSGSFQWKVL